MAWTASLRSLFRADLRPLLDVNFRRYYIGQTLSGFGDTLVPLALSFVVLGLTHSVAALGFVLMASRLPITVFTLFGGVLGDRLRRQEVMVVADLVRLVVHGITALLLLTGHAQLWHLMLLQGVAGTATAFFNPAATGLVSTLVDKDQLLAANSLLGISRSALQMLSLGVSAALVATIGGGWVFALNAATFAVSVFFLLRLRLDEIWTPAQTSILRQLAEGFQYVRASTWLLITIVYSALLNGLVLAPLMVLGPNVARLHLGGAGGWATIGISVAVGALLGSAISLKTRLMHPLSTAIGAALAAVPLNLLLVVPGPFWAILPAAVLYGAQASFFLAVSTTVKQTLISPDLISRVASYDAFGSLILIPLGLALTGVAADRFGTANVLIFTAAWTVLSTFVALCFPQVRRVGAVIPSGALAVRSISREVG